MFKDEKWNCFQIPVAHTASLASSCCSHQYCLWDTYIWRERQRPPFMSDSAFFSMWTAGTGDPHSIATPSLAVIDAGILTSSHHLSWTQVAKELQKTLQAYIGETAFKLLMRSGPGGHAYTPGCSQQPFSLRSPLHQTHKPGF